MPLINVQMLAGRTADQKATLIRELAQTTRKVLGVPEEALRIILTEVPPEHWGVGSRSMAQIRAAPPAGGQAE